MIRNPRNLLWLFPLALFVTSPLWKPPLTTFLTPRGGYYPQLAQIEQESPVQDFIMDGVTLTLANDGKQEWQIDAEKAFTGERDHEIDMVAVNARYIGNEKEPTHISSLKGTYFTDKKHLILAENVVVSKPTRQQQLESELLHYYDATKMVVSPGTVHVQAPNMRLTAGRMDYNLASGAYDFSNRVKVNL